MSETTTTRYQCPACSHRGKAWSGSDPVCGFDEHGEFVSENWMCATLNNLREEAEERGYRERDDFGPQSIAVLPLSYGYAVLSYYKDRGRVGRAMFMRDDAEPRPLRLSDITAPRHEEDGE